MKPEERRAVESDREAARLVDAYRRRDAVADRYSAFAPAHLYTLQSRERNVLRLLSDHGRTALRDLRVLDVGCGTGQWLLDLIRWGVLPAHLTGVDLNEDRVATARSRVPAAVDCHVADASCLPFDDGNFDLVVLATVLSSVLDDDLRTRIVDEVLRTVRPGGAVLVYDFAFDNPANADVRGVRRSERITLFGEGVAWRRTTLAPPIARRVAPLSTTLAGALEALPVFRTHVLGLVHKEVRR